MYKKKHLCILKHNRKNIAGVQCFFMWKMQENLIKIGKIVNNVEDVKML